MSSQKKSRKSRNLRTITYEEFFNNAPDMFLSVDTATGIIILCNDTLAKKTGYKKEEIIGKHVLEIIHSDSHAQAKKALEIFKKCGEIKDLDLQIRRKDKRIIDISINVTAIRDKDGNILCCRSVWRDITDRKKIDDNRFKAIVDDQTELICRFKPDCTLTFVNKAYCRYFCKEEEDLVGENFKIFLTEDAKHIIDLHISSFTPEDPIKEVEHKVNLPDGKVGWQEWTDRAFFNENGSLMEFQSVGRDITKRKTFENRLKESEKCYRQLTELASYGILLHDGERIIFMNSAGLKLLGAVDLEEIKDREIIDFIHPHYKDLAKKRIRSVLENAQKSPLEEFKINRLDGETVHVEAIAGPISFNEKNCVQVLIHDVTILKETTEQLKMKNIALYELTEQIEIAKNKIKEDVLNNVENVLMPIIEKGNSKGLARKHVNMLKYYLDELTSAYGRVVSSKRFDLTSREIEICNLVRHGQSNKEIANLLNVSVITVEKHRNNIRNKLGIAKRNVNLADFLKRLE